MIRTLQYQYRYTDLRSASTLVHLPTQPLLNLIAQPHADSGSARKVARKLLSPDHVDCSGDASAAAIVFSEARSVVHHDSQYLEFQVDWFGKQAAGQRTEAQTLAFGCDKSAVEISLEQVSTAVFFSSKYGVLNHLWAFLWVRLEVTLMFISGL